MNPISAILLLLSIPGIKSLDFPGDKAIYRWVKYGSYYRCSASSGSRAGIDGSHGQGYHWQHSNGLDSSFQFCKGIL
jgi:hypothetical protein